MDRLYKNRCDRGNCAVDPCAPLVDAQPAHPTPPADTQNFPSGYVLRGETSIRALRRAPLVPSYHCVPGGIVTDRGNPYYSVGPIGQFRNCLNTLLALGQQDVTAVAATLATGTYTAAMILGAPALGVLLDIGGETDSSNYTMTVALNNFVSLGGMASSQSDGAGGVAAISVDRSLVLRVNRPCSGFKLYIPFALRNVDAMGSGMMSIGVSDGPEDATTGLLRAAADRVGTVTIDGISAGFTSFSMTATLLTAFSPALAEYAALVEGGA